MIIYLEERQYPPKALNGKIEEITTTEILNRTLLKRPSY